jgi:hypothetical protein
MTGDVNQKSPNVRVALGETEIAIEDAGGNATDPLIVEIDNSPEVGEIANQDGVEKGTGFRAFR